MVPFGTTTITGGRNPYTHHCPNCGSGTCGCFIAGFNSATTGAVQTLSYGSYHSNTWPELEEFKKACEESKLKQGWRLEVGCTKEVVPTKPRVELRAAPSPRLVGGGPMRRRWR